MDLQRESSVFSPSVTDEGAVDVHCRSIILFEVFLHLCKSQIQSLSSSRSNLSLGEEQEDEAKSTSGC